MNFLRNIYAFMPGIFQIVLRWSGHVERMDEYRMARRVLMAEVSGDGYEGDRG